jgi:phage gpG-like protein
VPVHLKITITGTEQAHRVMMGFAERATDASPAFEDIKTSFIEHEEKWFASEGDGTWPALSRDYEHWKSRHFPGKPILELTGHLKDTATQPDISIIEPMYAIFGTGDPIARYHQDGTSKMPARPVIEMDDETIDDWAKILQRHIVEGTL